MIILNVELLSLCREYGLKTIEEINKFIKKHELNTNKELENKIKKDMQISKLREE